MKKRLRWLLGILLAAALFVWAFSWGLGIWTIDWDNPAPFMEGDVEKISYLDGKLVANLEQYRIDYVAIDEMPGHLVDAFVAIEDHRFYKHGGVDLLGLGRAVFVNLRARDITQGGSTITQQLARNLFLNLEQNLVRKLAEMSIALQLERKYDKDEILEMYINQVNFGAGNWGVSRAAAAYFNKSVSELTIGESALLAGLVQAPNYYAPVEDWDRAITRQRYVLSRMVEYGYITSEQAAAEVYQEGS
ncbi:MAG TPA: biosynthetic peptidoglycan transglycosylase [Bacillota bacterium]|jgi:membrane peptidoglycan carboxypeptidase|nr:biosynthetic peptidoglycan transglycosylase [Bacillota bacterium]HPZ22455.1 biosynthetic peptidoglycan transglycosylase [Bacillota bacterium]HQD20336.1 biosynthetic peptidoglycan transglycosylase [Bacillota bacterium]